MEELNIKKEEFEKAKNYLITVAHSTKNGITGFNVYLLFDDGTIKKVVGGGSWNKKKGYYHCTVWGMDRALNILDNIAAELGATLNQDKIKKLY